MTSMPEKLKDLKEAQQLWGPWGWIQEHTAIRIPSFSILLASAWLILSSKFHRGWHLEPSIPSRLHLHVNDPEDSEHPMFDLTLTTGATAGLTALCAGIQWAQAGHLPLCSVGRSTVTVVQPGAPHGSGGGMCVCARARARACVYAGQ